MPAPPLPLPLKEATVAAADPLPTLLLLPAAEKAAGLPSWLHHTPAMEACIKKQASDHRVRSDKTHPSPSECMKQQCAPINSFESGWWQSCSQSSPPEMTAQRTSGACLPGC